MKKFFTSFGVAVVIFVSQACATGAGYTGFNGLSFPGYEAAGVAAANAAMPYQILAVGQPGWLYHGQPTGYAPDGYQWVCQPVSLMHELKDVGYAALGMGSFLGWRGVGAGAGGAGYLANHEKDCYLQLQSAGVSQAVGLSPYLVRVENPNNIEAVLFDGSNEVGVIPPMGYRAVPPAASGFRAVLNGVDQSGRPVQLPAEIAKPHTQERILEIRPIK